MDVEPVVFVIAGDSKARRNLSLRLKQLGCALRLFHSPDDFQRNSSPHDAGCILLQVAHADIDLDWLTTLGPRHQHWPVIGIAAEADVETAVLAMKRGTCDFLLETCSDRRLRAAVDEALRGDAEQRRLIAQARIGPPPPETAHAAAARRARTPAQGQVEPRGCRRAGHERSLD